MIYDFDFVWTTHIMLMFCICIVRLNFYGFLSKECIYLIVVIQTFYPAALDVLYGKDVYPTSSIS